MFLNRVMIATVQEKILKREGSIWGLVLTQQIEED